MAGGLEKSKQLPNLFLHYSRGMGLCIVIENSIFLLIDVVFYGHAASDEYIHKHLMFRYLLRTPKDNIPTIASHIRYFFHETQTLGLVLEICPRQAPALNIAIC